MSSTKDKVSANAFISRRKALAKRLASAGVDAILLTRPQDVGYLCAFTGETGALLVGGGWAALLTDSIHAEQAEAECKSVDIHVGRAIRTVKEALRGRHVRRLGVIGDKTHLTGWLELQDQLGERRVVAVSDLVGECRLIKDDLGVRTIKRAVRAAETAFKAMLAQGRKGFVGRTEREVAAELDYRMRLAGADGPAFDTIVAAGAGASRPHYRPADRKIRANEIVLIDWGASVGGYCSDLTRVVLTGRISPQLTDAYETTRRAQQAALQAVKPRVMAGAPDRAARAVIDDSPFKGRFIHSVGHGLGRDVHEGPPVSAGNLERLRPGMVVTIEPGIYLPGVGGIRLEDDVLVTSQGRRKLSSLPTEIGRMTLV
jgi:Xaa-Pro aminopeptidase